MSCLVKPLSFETCLLSRILGSCALLFTDTHACPIPGQSNVPFLWGSSADEHKVTSNTAGSPIPLQSHTSVCGLCLKTQFEFFSSGKLHARWHVSPRPCLCYARTHTHCKTDTSSDLGGGLNLAQPEPVVYAPLRPPFLPNPSCTAEDELQEAHLKNELQEAHLNGRSTSNCSEQSWQRQLKELEEEVEKVRRSLLLRFRVPTRIPAVRGSHHTQRWCCLLALI